MFSANENIQLRQYKRRIVDYVESCIPESVLDAGTNVMVMQVACKAPGCVPLETAIIIVFPSATANGKELLPGLPESQGGSFKTKVLKPMSQVTKQDVLEALPPAFPGGQRSMERLCLAARDVMLAQITQMTDDVTSRKLVAQYLQNSLQDYMDRGCEPPTWGEPFPELGDETVGDQDGASVDKGQSQDKAESSTPSKMSSELAEKMEAGGNLVLRRPKDDGDLDTTRAPGGGIQPSVSGTDSATASVSTNHYSGRRQYQQQQRAERELHASTSTSTILTRLYEREHAPGVRRPGCPCCDPDNPANVVDQMINL